MRIIETGYKRRNIWNLRFHWYILNPYKDTKFAIKEFFHYCRYGYRKADIWNLDHTLCKWLQPRLKCFNERTGSYPPDLTFKEWKEILNKIEKSLELWTDDACKDREEIQEGFDLLGQYLVHLWD